MREILFRGKTEEGVWTYGYLFVQAEGTEYEEAFILGELDYRESVYEIWKCAERVNPKTIGQYTGFKDKSGAKIFEGDIVSTRRNGTRTEKLKGYYGYDSDGYPKRIPGYEGAFEYHYPCQVDCYAEVKRDWRGGFYLEGTSMFVNAICNKVAGNIHDNPELVEVK